MAQVAAAYTGTDTWRSDTANTTNIIKQLRGEEGSSLATPLQVLRREAVPRAGGAVICIWHTRAYRFVFLNAMPLLKYDASAASREVFSFWALGLLSSMPWIGVKARLDDMPEVCCPVPRP
jgi:hypothetical protein